MLFTLLPLLTGGEWGGKAYGQNYNYRELDPLDTLDEVDLARMRDTVKMSRQNLADKPGAINALDYILKDRYSPNHHSFDNHWYDHLYVGASLGVEQINPQSSNYKFRTITQINALVGKQFDRKNSLRLSIGGGWGYQRDRNLWLKRVQLKMDYLFNLSTHFFGYNPARRIETSLLFGVGGNYSWMDDNDKQLAPEAHFGVQLKCFTGPFGNINIEPYLGLSSDKVDISGTRNWRGYDFLYGVNVNYAFYLVDNLSKEARLALLQSRMADDRMVDPETIEKWRTPWFVEYSMGPVMSSSNALDFSKTMGSQTTLSVGRWLSPVMGFRISAATRANKHLTYTTEPTAKEGGYVRNYNSHYVNGRIEALVNPFGFTRNFKWDSKWGAYLTFGVGMGMITKYYTYDRLYTKSESYHLGAHLWYRISEDLQAFVEPHYSHNVYTIPYENVRMRKMNGDNNFGVDLGLSLLIRSRKYHDLYEMDHTQHYTYRNIRGVRIGVGAGMPVLQHKEVYFDKNNAMNWNGLAFVEYRFNHLHGVRAQADFVTLNSSYRSAYVDICTTPLGVTTNTTRNGLIDYNRKLLLGSLNYEVSLTNLCSGRFHDRLFELEAFAGPAVGYMLKTDRTVNPMEPMAEGQHALFPAAQDEKKMMMGLDFGFKLSTHIWKGISVYLTPTMYFLNKKGGFEGLHTVSFGDMHLYQTINLGVQYKVGKLRRNPEMVKRIHLRQDRDWNNKQLEKERKWAEKQLKKQEERRAKRYSK